MKAMRSLRGNTQSSFLQEESSQDMEHREWCDKEMGQNEKARTSHEAEVDDTEAKVESAQSAVAKLAAEIAELVSQLAENKESLANQTKAREAEQAENDKTITDAREANKAVAESIAVLREYYASMKKPSFVQTATKLREAPKVFDGAYTGQGSDSVIAMLEAGPDVRGMQQLLLRSWVGVLFRLCIAFYHSKQMCSSSNRSSTVSLERSPVLSERLVASCPAGGPV